MNLKNIPKTSSYTENFEKHLAKCNIDDATLVSTVFPNVLFRRVLISFSLSKMISTLSISCSSSRLSRCSMDFSMKYSKPLETSHKQYERIIGSACTVYIVKLHNGVMKNIHKTLTILGTICNPLLLKKSMMQGFMCSDPFPNKLWNTWDTIATTGIVQANENTICKIQYWYVYSCQNANYDVWSSIHNFGLLCWVLTIRGRQSPHDVIR